MKQKNVLVLSALTVAALALALLTQRSDTTSSKSVAEGKLFPELDARLNDVAEVRIEKFGKSATLRKDGGHWVLADRAGYPAKFEKVKELAMRVASLKLQEKKTARKESLAKLGLAWPAPATEGSEEAQAGLVVLKDASGTELAALVLGKSEWMGSKPKVYARRLSEDQAWLCEPSGSIELAPEAKNWIEPEIVKLDNERVQSVTIAHADGELVDLARSATDHNQFSVQAVPPGKVEKFAGVANGVAQTLGSGLTLEDVRAVTEIDFAKEPLAKTSFKTTDGLELAIELAKFEDKTYARFVATYTPPPEAAGPAPAAEGETKPEGETPAEPARDVGKEASELNARLAPWAYELPSWRSDALLRRMSDLVNDPAAENPPGSADGGLGNALQGLGYDDQEPAPVEPATPPVDEGGTPPTPEGGG